MNINHRKTPYDYGQKPQASAPIVEKMVPEKLEEFKTHYREWEEKLEEKYGRSSVEQMRLEKFQRVISNFQRCKLEVFLTFYDTRSRDLLKYVSLNYTGNDGEDTLGELKAEINHSLKLPWKRRMNLFDYRFKVEYKEKGGITCILLSHDFGHETILAKYKIAIREI